MNKYLEDRARKRRDRRSHDRYSRRDMYRDRRDMYNDGRGSDRAMDRHNSYPERMGRMYNRDMSDYRGQDYHMGRQQSREHYRPYEHEMYGQGMRGHYDHKQGYEDFAYDSNYDYNYDRDYDYASGDMEKEWHEDLEEWCQRLKRSDRFNLSKEDIMNKAKQMNVHFDKYNEKEFMTTYYMMLSDYKSASNDPHLYLSMAKQWLEDEDVALKGGEKLAAYYYEIVKGGEQ